MKSRIAEFIAGSFIALLIAMPAYSETIFRASPIDRLQDARLDVVEAALSSQGQKIDKLLALAEAKPPVVQVPVVQPQPVAPKPTPVVRPVQAPQVAQNGRYSTDELRSLIRAKRPGGWQGAIYADVQPRSLAKQHLVGSEHGFSWDQVSGLSQEEALILHDLAPNHGNQIFPSGPRSNRPSVPLNSAIPSEQYGCAKGQCDKDAQVQQRSGCADSQCANSSAAASRPVVGGGFSLFKRFRR